MNDNSAVVPVPTRDGLEILGALIRKARGVLSQADFADLVSSNGLKVSKTTISEIENGHREPAWSTLAAIASTKLVRNPVSGQPWSTADLFLIACEEINPDSGSHLVLVAGVSAGDSKSTTKPKKSK